MIPFSNSLQKSVVLLFNPPHRAQPGFLSADAPAQLQMARDHPSRQHSGPSVTHRQPAPVPPRPGVQRIPLPTCGGERWIICGRFLLRWSHSEDSGSYQPLHHSQSAQLQEKQGAFSKCQFQ